MFASSLSRPVIARDVLIVRPSHAKAMNGFRHNNDPFGEQGEYCSLKQVASGRWGTIVALPHERHHRDRLIGMGIVIGQIFHVNHNSKAGPSLITIDQQRLALDGEIAEQIIVVPKPETEHAISSALTRLKEIWSLPS